MKKTLKFLSSVLLISTLGLVNCHKYETGGSQANGFVVGTLINSLIQSATSGNCAISVNLGSLYAGGIVQNAAANSTLFTQAQYEAVTGSTVTNQNYASYAAVPFNKKYDAFLTNSSDTTTWTDATRKTAVATMKAQIDSFALMGAVLVITGGGVTNNATTQAAVSAYYATFTDAEKTAMVTVAAGINNIVSLGGSATVGALDGVIGAASGLGLVGAAPYTSLVGAIGATAAQTAVVGAYTGANAYKNGLALMACARIPKSQCSYAALVTGTREAALSSLATSYNGLALNSDCKKPTLGVLQNVLTQGALGLQKDESFLGKSNSITLMNGLVYKHNLEVGGSEGSTSSFTGNKIFASKAYPISTSLLSIASSFTSALPLNSGSTPYSTDTFYGGSNLNATSVTSCEAIGLPQVGPTPIQETDSLATRNAKKPLTDVKEITYAFSVQNAAASAYYSARLAEVVSTPTTVAELEAKQNVDKDAIACNRSFRKLVTVSALLGVGTTLPVIDATSGDGGATSLITSCVYGGTSTPRGYEINALVAGVPTLAGLTSCPANASSGASNFGATGLTTYTDFPNGL